MNRPLVLFVNVLVIATCGLVYELLAGTVASYVLGDSVTQFSLVIGLYLGALGLGAWLSRYLGASLARRFVELETMVALLGGCSAPLLFLSFAHLRFFNLALYAVVLAVGVLVGLEVPLLLRILKDELEFKDLISRVLTFDYAGSVLAAVLFPLLLVPRLGLVRTSLLFGLCNAAVGLWATFLLRNAIKGSVVGLRLRAVVVTGVLAAGLLRADWLTSLAEDSLYADEIIYAKSTPYQRIVLTRSHSGFNLFLNGHLQFSSADEYRYHEALVHPALLLQAAPKRVLVLGGGDGLALREILQYAGVEAATLVDLDPGMTGLSASFPLLAELNRNAFRDPRVQVVNADALTWLEHPDGAYDAVILDFPDPNSFSLGKLYTTRFYRLLKQALAPGASVAVQCTSPLFARASYWCIIRTLEAAGFSVRPYQVAVPSFGVWGFALARLEPFEPPSRAPEHARFLNDQTLAALFVLSADMAPLPVEINRLDNQVLVRYYEADWRHWE
ncbi:MAG: polyamine aminopropyltransferase [Planctomycetota bacterium]